MSDETRANGGDDHDNGSAEFLEQARWLLEWHNRRGEAITTRATAVLGFVGVVLALLLQGAGLDGFETGLSTWLVLLPGLAALLASGLFALLVIVPTGADMPSVAQLRQWWAEQMADPSRGLRAAQIAESILKGQEQGEDSPISDALTVADKRAKWFKKSAIALLVAFGCLTALVVDVLIRAGS